jgi:hypothetical protein
LLSLTMILSAAAPAQYPEQLPSPTPSIVRMPAVNNRAQAPQDPSPKANNQAIPPKAPPAPPRPTTPYGVIDYEHPIPAPVGGFATNGPWPTAPAPVVLQPYRTPERADPWLARNAGEPRWSHVQRTRTIFRSRFDLQQSAGYVPAGTIRD